MASTSPNRTFLERTVYHDEADRGRVELNALDLWKEALPIVLIGDPGMGKSYLTEALVDANPAAKLVKAGAFVRNPKKYAFADNETCLVIDGLDEVAARAPGQERGELVVGHGAVGEEEGLVGSVELVPVLVGHLVAVAAEEEDDGVCLKLHFAGGGAVSLEADVVN